jgi:hypothetical protein
MMAAARRASVWNKPMLLALVQMLACVAVKQQHRDILKASMAFLPWGLA